MRSPPTRVRHFEQARREHGRLAESYAHALWRVDPLADDVVEWMGESGGRAVLERAISRGLGATPDAPACLVAFIEALEAAPPWLDHAQVNLGAHVYRRCGVAAALTLSAHSLMGGYESAAASKPLALTGQLEVRAVRRLAETGRFVTEVVQPDGVRRHGKGFELCARVRIMHAQVRRLLERSGRWDERAWGAPINQADMLFTGVEFSSMMLRGARALGHSFTATESDATMHLWRYVCHLLGVDAELHQELTTEARANQYEALARLTFDGPDEDSVALATALRRAIRQSARTPRERVEAWLLTPVHDGLAWKLNGPKLARALQIPNPHAAHLVDLIAALAAPLDLARRHSERLDAWMAEQGNRDFRRRIASSLGGREPRYQAVTTTHRRAAAR